MKPKFPFKAVWVVMVALLFEESVTCLLVVLTAAMAVVGAM
jgi:hypothetical protein